MVGSRRDERKSRAAILGIVQSACRAKNNNAREKRI
jgi:hypothetical protein